MIQAPLPKPIELPKAQPKRADAEVVSNQKQPSKVAAKKNEVSSKEGKENKKEVSEFDKELESATGEATPVEGEAQVKAVQVSEDLELPSKLVNPNGSVETTSPKIFDPSITKDVEKLIQPKSADGKPVVLTDEQIAQLANGEVDPKVMNAELEQAMLKTPKTASGRAPAIDFAKAEVDPQLLNNEDFVAQKNMAAKKAAPNAYGMKVVPQTQQQKVAMENGLQQSQVVKEASANESAMNSQQFILGLQSEQKGVQLNETQAPVKTFDMSNIKSSQPTEIMNQITDYVVQAKAAKEPTVNMRVNHDELGMIDITVSRVGHANTDTLAISIGAHSMEGKNFFSQNSKDLFAHLTTAGINVHDLKVETPTQTAKSDFDFGSQSGRNGQGGSGEKQFGSEQNQRRHDQERRQDLWKLLSKEAA